MPARTNRNSPRSKTGIGIAGMRERIAQLGGRFEMRSGENGTVALAILPVMDTSELTASQGLAL
jgi:signal transduction histidine kinase